MCFWPDVSGSNMSVMSASFISIDVQFNVLYLSLRFLQVLKYCLHGLLTVKYSITDREERFLRLWAYR